ncbi:MAG: DUF1343 domain-containing protein [Sphingobacteriales bacterium]|nr:MAG: DUF1343 domain-containing protein [Sphingobacteriales bacterium]
MRPRLLYSLLLLIFSINGFTATAQTISNDGYDYTVITGADRTDQYLPLLKGKKVALVINQASRIFGEVLLDTLLTQKVKITKVFVPEHGFRGKAEAGEAVANEKDKETGIEIISLYGNNKKPQKKDLKNVDVVIYDLQDVGVRFYTYISTLEYLMDACIENDKELIILDRPNPNGHYVDGPVLDTSLRSFVGMQPVPIVYGMTVGEYAKMLVGEKWIANTDKLKMTVIPCQSYNHKTPYRVLYDPSPNLRSMAAIYCYPTVCLFEGTPVSVGRGTTAPFQHWGHPDFKGRTLYNFTPVPVWGAKVDPPYAYKACYGQAVAMGGDEAKRMLRDRVRLVWLIRAYEWWGNKDGFFTPFFDKLAGTRELKKQITQGMDENAIYATWEKDLQAFKKIRKKYLLYADFE